MDGSASVLAQRVKFPMGARHPPPMALSLWDPRARGLEDAVTPGISRAGEWKTPGVESAC